VKYLKKVAIIIPIAFQLIRLEYLEKLSSSPILAKLNSKWELLQHGINCLVSLGWVVMSKSQEVVLLCWWQICRWPTSLNEFPILTQNLLRLGKKFYWKMIRHHLVFWKKIFKLKSCLEQLEMNECQCLIRFYLLLKITIWFYTIQ